MSNTKTCNKMLWLAGAVSAALFSTAASAQSSDHWEDGGQWSIGLGVVAVDKPYYDFDQEVYPLPVINYENEWISASVPTFDVKLFRGDSLSLRARVKWAGDGYEAKDSPVLTGMEERKSSIWAGGALVWDTEAVKVTAEVLSDAMSESKGTTAKLQVDHRFSAGRFGFTPRLVAEWVDDKYVNYYYGVRADEVTAGRALYEGKATTNFGAGLTVDFSPSEHHTLFLDVGGTRYGSTVEDSPLVDKPNQVTLALGYSYRF